MLRRLAQQRMTLRDLEWPFHALRAISAVAELLVSKLMHNDSSTQHGCVVKKTTIISFRRERERFSFLRDSMKITH